MKQSIDRRLAAARDAL